MHKCCISEDRHYRLGCLWFPAATSHTDGLQRKLKYMRNTVACRWSPGFGPCSVTQQWPVGSKPCASASRVSRSPRAASDVVARHLYLSVVNDNQRLAEDNAQLKRASKQQKATVSQLEMENGRLVLEMQDSRHVDRVCAADRTDVGVADCVEASRRLLSYTCSMPRAVRGYSMPPAHVREPYVAQQLRTTIPGQSRHTTMHKFP